MLPLGLGGNKIDEVTVTKNHGTFTFTSNPSNDSNGGVDKVIALAIKAAKMLPQGDAVVTINKGNVDDAIKVYKTLKGQGIDIELSDGMIEKFRKEIQTRGIAGNDSDDSFGRGAKRASKAAAVLDALGIQQVAPSAEQRAARKESATTPLNKTAGSLPMASAPPDMTVPPKTTETKTQELIDKRTLAKTVAAQTSRDIVLPIDDATTNPRPKVQSTKPGR